MDTVKEYYDLEAWKTAHRLALRVYEVTKIFPKDELFGVTNQLRRAASSVSANIAEGFERYHYNDKIRFYHQARGSAAEVQNFVMLARDLKYIEVLLCDELMHEAAQVRQLINGMIRSINSQKLITPKTK